MVPLTLEVSVACVRCGYTLSRARLVWVNRQRMYLAALLMSDPPGDRYDHVVSIARLDPLRHNETAYRYILGSTFQEGSLPVSS